MFWEALLVGSKINSGQDTADHHRIEHNPPASSNRYSGLLIFLYPNHIEKDPHCQSD